MSNLIINHRSIPFEEIQNQLPKTTLEKKVFDFCSAWLSGQEYFEIYTSGSTGKPKCIKIHRSQMQISAEMTAQALQLKKGDTALVCLNVEYIAGKMMLVRALEIKMDCYVIEPSANPLLNFPTTTHFDFVALVPMQLQNILKSELKNERTKLPILQKIKAIIVGGAAVSQELENELQVVKAPIYSTYGMTETITHIALKRLNGKQKSNYYTTLPKVKIKQDSRACLMICSPTTLDNWLTSNDLVTIIDKNTFEYLGRIDHVINSGGVKIQAEKVEKAIKKVLLDFKIEANFAIIPLKDKLLGQSVNLVIELAQLDREFEDAFFYNLKNRLSLYEIPKRIFYLTEFPRTLTNKIDKKELIKLLVY